jgi:hypothetical protein
VVDRCILKDTKVFECFSMHLVIFVVYISMYFNIFESILHVLIVYLRHILIYL